ncbi:sensor histidine kinase [Paludibaculum fermentans]|uniref:histidine kinase n=1 Tax=Paludibaculum fermentans TaxID=1473598 RepID=A0A7S7SLE7_PALFE|nr:HAMP domain-containing sensor histidine kinase [Paludibaculum fermentans]QOY88356.1 HAMP domain-containing histidine kinase [Paludibaculum fermentans]
MGRSFSSRALVAVSSVLAFLLVGLAVLQYQWSGRISAADAQREREHLNSAAQLFASEFNGVVSQSVRFLQNEANTALRSGAPLTGTPKLIGELYYLNLQPQKPPEVLRLTAEGMFVPASRPEWLPAARCSLRGVEDPSTIFAPIFDIVSVEHKVPGEAQITKTIKWGMDRCFVARFDTKYVSETLFPSLIQKSFGGTAASEYDFAVVSLNRPDQRLYGGVLHADLRTVFPAMDVSLPIPLPPAAATGSPPRQRASVLIQRENHVFTSSLTSLRDTGLWELQIAHKGMPMAAAFERKRGWDLLVSLGVDVLLFAAVAFLVIAARRMQWLADQKMRFVAGVSHELRTPVSAIAMLSRNQADGLVTGPDKVKQYGELIHQQSRRLNEMVEQTLQLAGIHSGLRRPAKDEVDLRSLIEDSIGARREELTRGGFELEVDLASPTPPIVGDSKLLRTAFDNLLDNALKHAGGGRWIRVSAVHAPLEKEIRLSVEDRGDGIDPTDQTEIFEPFSRGRAAVEAQIPGSGLGLSLVRSAAEAHRGSVTLVSRPGRGSTFTLHLPL